jgi:thiosulfate dehydrogenase [quinone] large subunit
VIAAALLAAFYLSAMPLTGLPVPRAEGTYLIVNKNLIELLAVAVVMAFRTGRIAGLDLLLRRRRSAALQPTETMP